MMRGMPMMKKKSGNSILKSQKSSKTSKDGLTSKVVKIYQIPKDFQGIYQDEKPPKYGNHGENHYE